MDTDRDLQQGAARVELIRNARKTARNGEPDEVIALFDSSERLLRLVCLPISPARGGPVVGSRLMGRSSLRGMLLYSPGPPASQRRRGLLRVRRHLDESRGRRRARAHTRSSGARDARAIAEQRALVSVAMPAKEGYPQTTTPQIGSSFRSGVVESVRRATVTREGQIRALPPEPCMPSWSKCGRRRTLNPEAAGSSPAEGASTDCGGAWPPRRCREPEIAGSTPASQMRGGGAATSRASCARDVGSNPTRATHPGGVAQTSRALACQARGRRFEPGRPRSW